MTVESSALFAAEWGIQIIGVSQTASALELVALINIFSAERSEFQSREIFRKIKLAIRLGLIFFALAVTSLPVSYIIRAESVYKRDEKDFIELTQDKHFLELQIKFQRFAISVNIFVCILLITSQLVAICALRGFFGGAYNKEIQSITLILFSFSTCYLVRSGYEAYANVRNNMLLQKPNPQMPG